MKALEEYKDHADSFICSVIPGAPFSSSQYTPGILQINSSFSQLFAYLPIMFSFITLSLSKVKATINGYCVFVFISLTMMT